MTDKAPERIWATGDGTIGSWSASEVRMKIHMPDGWETEYVRADIHLDVVAERDKLREVLQDVHDDLLARGKTDMRGGKTVAVGASVWIGICKAIGETEND